MKNMAQDLHVGDTIKVGGTKARIKGIVENEYGNRISLHLRFLNVKIVKNKSFRKRRKSMLKANGHLTVDRKTLFETIAG